MACSTSGRAGLGDEFLTCFCPPRYYYPIRCPAVPVASVSCRLTHPKTGAMDDDMSMDMDMSMSTSFDLTCDVGPLLFDWWTVDTCVALYLSCIPVILLGVARHWVFSLVTGGAKIPRKTSSGPRTTALLDANGFETSSSSSSQQEPMGRLSRLIWTLISTTGAALSLLSMLVVMTYNGGLFIAVLVGEFIGFWIWGNHSLPEAMRGCH